MNRGEASTRRTAPTIAPLALVALMASVGCPGEPPDANAPAANRAPSETPATTPAAAGSAALPETLDQEILSADGTYVIRYRTIPDPIPLNEVFRLDACVSPSGSTTTDLAGVTLAIDARMPDHRHGLNRRPSVTAVDDGCFEVDGLLFHMPGFWELHFDVTDGGVTERAQADVELR